MPRPTRRSSTWTDITPASAPALDAAAARHGFHPLHVEDCRHPGQRAKVEAGEGYLFVVLTRATLAADDTLVTADLALFVGPDYLVTVHDGPAPALAALSTTGTAATATAPGAALPFDAGEACYRVLDAVVDGYGPLLDAVEDRVDALEDDVLARPNVALLERVADLRGTLLEIRRVLSTTRQVTLWLHRAARAPIGDTDQMPPLGRALRPFLRDVHDHLARALDAVARERDRLAGLLELHQAGVANRNAEAARLLTVLGTAALPALLVAALFGMNVRYPVWVSGPSAFPGIGGATALVTAGLLWRLKRRGYF